MYIKFDRIFLGAVIIACMAVLPINIIMPSLGVIAESFDASHEQVFATVSIFAVAGALAQLLVGPLSDWVGRRTITLVALALFIGASIGCALAHNVETFTIFRSAQAVVLGIYGVAVATIRDVSSDEEMASRLSHMASAWALVPIVGPTLGGLIAEVAGWRSVFIFLAVCGLLAFVFAAKLLSNTSDRAVSFREYTRAYRSIIVSRMFLACSATSALALGALYLFLGYVAAVTQSMNVEKIWGVGLIIAFAPFGFVVGSVLSGRLSKADTLTRNLFLGRGAALVGLIIAAILSMIPGWDWLSLPAAGFSVGFGNALTLPNISALAIRVRREMTGAAVGLLSASSLAGAGVISFLASIWNPGDGGATTLIAMLGIIVLASTLTATLAARTRQSI